MARDRRQGVASRIASGARRALADAAEDRVTTAAGKVRDTARNAFRKQFTCTCSPDRTFRGHKELNAHHLARHAGRWSGQQAKKMARKMGKDLDNARRHARGTREAHGLTDAQGVRTARGSTRPELRGMVKWRQLRDAHRHHGDHDRAEQLDARADRAAAGIGGGRARPPDALRQARSDRHQEQADALRARHGTPARTRS